MTSVLSGITEMSTTQRKPLSRVEGVATGVVALLTVTMGHVGFVHRAIYVADRSPDSPPALDAFVDAFGHELMDAGLVRFDGAAVSLSAMELA